jgi:hypothetical protein
MKPQCCPLCGRSSAVAGRGGRCLRASPSSCPGNEKINFVALGTLNVVGGGLVVFLFRAVIYWAAFNGDRYRSVIVGRCFAFVTTAS